MTPTPDARERLQRFLSGSAFFERGAVMTDLDGTAVHEHEGVVRLSPSMVPVLERLHRGGCPVFVNTLRFPLWVIDVIGDEWAGATGDAVPVVSLKGSQVGHVVRSSGGMLAFEELAAFPLQAGELAEVMSGVRGMTEQGIDDDHRGLVDTVRLANPADLALLLDLAACLPAR